MVAIDGRTTEEEAVVQKPTPGVGTLRRAQHTPGTLQRPMHALAHRARECREGEWSSPWSLSMAMP